MSFFIIKYHKILKVFTIRNVKVWFFMWIWDQDKFLYNFISSTFDYLKVIIHHIHLNSYLLIFTFFYHLGNFLHEKCFWNPKVSETALNEFAASRTITFYDTGIKKNLFCIGKSVLKLMVSILINKVCSVKIYSFFK